MSSQERHPLDELFRQKLAQAEAPPPPGVLDAVLRERARRKRPGFFSNGWMLGLLVLVFTLAGGAYQHMGRGVSDPAEGATARNKADENTVTDEGATSDRDNTSLDERSSIGREDDPRSTTLSTAAEGIHREPDIGMAVQAKNTPVIKPGSGGLDVAISAVVDPVAHPQRNTGNDPEHYAVDNDAPLGDHGNPLPERPEQGTPTPLDPLWITFASNTGMASPLQRQAHGPYVLPNGEWWLGASVSFHDVRLHWTGDQERLAQALESAESVHSTTAIGLSFGRAWRNGWGLSTGLFFERSERHFEHTERTTIVETEVSTYVITLNTEVFVVDVDTIEQTTTTTELHTSGINRRSVLRIPIEGRWGRSLGRWSLEVRAGAAVELTKADNALSLELEGADGALVARQFSGAAAADRHPVSLLLTGGLDAGYLLHERWSLYGGPVYMHGIAPLEPAAPVYAMPQRWGLQFGLIHHFNDRQRTR